MSEDYRTIKQAVKDLRDSNLKVLETDVELLVIDGELPACAPTPRFLPGAIAAGSVFEPEAEIFTDLCSLRLTECYRDPLADYCRLLRPITWDENRVSCRGIEVMAETEKVPTRDPGANIPPRMSINGGVVECSGYDRWTFDGKDIRIEKHAIREYAINRNARKKRDAILQAAALEAEMIWNDAVLPNKKRSVDEIKIACLDIVKKGLCKKITKAHLSDENLWTIFTGKQDKRNFIGKLLKKVFAEAGIKKTSAQKLYAEAKKS